MSLAKVPIFGAEPYGFKATDISGCRVWLDASDVSTTYSVLPQTGVVGYSDYTMANDQNLMVWQDKSIGGNDFIKNVDPTNIQNTGPIYQGPTIVAPDSYLTPMAVLNFNQGETAGSGSNEPRFLQQNLVAVGGYTDYSSAIGPRIGTGISATTDIFVVVRPKFLTVAGDVFSIGSRPGETADFTSLSITSDGYWKIRSQGSARDVTSDNPESFSSFSNVTGEDSGYRILHMSLSNNNYVLRRMGSVVGSNASHTWSPTLANYRYYIGRANSAASAGNYFNGKIGEICVYNNIISTEKRLIIESFMAKRWNLVDLLPLDHPARLTNIPIFLGGTSLAAAPNGYTNRGGMRKIFVHKPDSLSTVTQVIGNNGSTLTATISLKSSFAGLTDYYNVTTFDSTDNSTFSVARYIPRYPFNGNVTQSLVYPLPSVDDKYYKTQVEARNLGGSQTLITTSVRHSVPSEPTNLSISYYFDNASLVHSMAFNITAGTTGGIPTGYTVELWRSTSSDGEENKFVWSLAGNPISMNIPYTSPTMTFELPDASEFWPLYLNASLSAGPDTAFIIGRYHYFTIVPYNGSGAFNGKAFSAVWAYSTSGGS